MIDQFHFGRDNTLYSASLTLFHATDLRLRVVTSGETSPLDLVSPSIIHSSIGGVSGIDTLVAPSTRLPTLSSLTLFGVLSSRRETIFDTPTASISDSKRESIERALAEVLVS